MLTTASWYEPNKWRGTPVRISNTAGRGIAAPGGRWDVLKFLIPDWTAVKAFRGGEIDQAEFEARYRARLDRDRDQLEEWVAALTPDADLTLLCHEREGQFCHRQLVAGLVRERRPDVAVDEH